MWLLSRRLYTWSIGLSAPVIVCTTLMYILTLTGAKEFLTLSGAQMLFYSVLDTTPFVAIMLLFSLTFFAILGVLNCVILAMRFKSSKLPELWNPAIRIGGFQIFHILALFLYDKWAPIPALRIPIAALGFVLLVFLAIWTFLRLIKPIALQD